MCTLAERGYLAACDGLPWRKKSVADSGLKIDDERCGCNSRAFSDVLLLVGHLGSCYTPASK